MENNGKRERYYSKDGITISLVIAAILIFVGIYFIISGQNGKVPFTGKSTVSFSYEITSGGLRADDHNSSGIIIVFGVFMILAGAFDFVRGLSIRQVLNERGVNSMPVSEVKAIRRRNRESGNASANNQSYGSNTTGSQSYGNGYGANQSYGSNTTGSQSYGNSYGANQSYGGNSAGSQSYGNSYGANQSYGGNTTGNQSYGGQQNVIEKTIIVCPSCQQKLRVPAKKNRIEVTCPKCKTVFYTST